MKFDILGIIGNAVDSTLSMFNNAYDEGYVIYFLIGFIVLILWIVFF